MIAITALASAAALLVVCAVVPVLGAVDICADLQLAFSAQQDLCANNNTNEERGDGVCESTSSFMMINNCHDICLLNSCNTDITCEDVWEKLGVVAGCKNLVKDNFDECPECISGAEPYWTCIDAELEQLRAGACDTSGASFLGRGCAHVLSLLFVASVAMIVLT